MKPRGPQRRSGPEDPVLELKVKLERDGHSVQLLKQLDALIGYSGIGRGVMLPEWGATYEKSPWRKKKPTRTDERRKPTIEWHQSVEREDPPGDIVAGSDCGG